MRTLILLQALLKRVFDLRLLTFNFNLLVVVLTIYMVRPSAEAYSEPVKHLRWIFL